MLDVKGGWALLWLGGSWVKTGSFWGQLSHQPHFRPDVSGAGNAGSRHSTRPLRQVFPTALPYLTHTHRPSP